MATACSPLGLRNPLKCGFHRSPVAVTLAFILGVTAFYYLSHPRLGQRLPSNPAATHPEAGSKAPTHTQVDQAAKPGAPDKTSIETQNRNVPGARRRSITVVCVSDTHSLYQEEGLIRVPQGDMLLFPGDIELGTAAEGLRFSSWLEGLPITGPKVVTWGNMDTGAPGLKDPVPGAIVLVNTIQEISGYRIFGSPWTPRFAGAYQLDMDEEESFKFWSQLLPPDSDVDIILTHGPPYGVADSAGGKHRGDKGLLRAVQALKKAPLLWVCGHIHEQYGEHQVPHPRAPGGSILLINSATFYVQRPQHATSAQPRAVRLPEAVVVPRA